MAKTRRRSFSTPREIHINLGESVGSCVWQALRVSAKAIIIFHDPLSDGPLIPLQDLTEWVGVREGYYRSMNRGLEAKSSSYDDLKCLADRLREAERIIVWVAAGLDDQLMLAWLPQYFRLLEIDLDKLHIVQFIRHPDTGETVDYLGIIPDTVVRRHPPPRRLTHADIAVLDAGWKAVTSPEPTLLLELLHNKVGSDQRAAAQLSPPASSLPQCRHRSGRMGSGVAEKRRDEGALFHPSHYRPIAAQL